MCSESFKPETPAEPLPELVPPRVYRSGLLEVLAMAFPILVAMASSTVMGFADYVMVARVGVEQAAAVSPAGILVFVFVSFVGGILSCTNTFVSQSFARHEFSECSRYVWQALYIAVIGGAVSLLLWPVSPWLFRMIGHEADVRVHEVVYFQWRLLSIAGMGACHAMTGFFQGISRPKVSMVVALVANALNVFLNWVLIYGKLGFPAMEVRGAALATAIAATLQAVVLVGLFLSGGYARRFRSKQVWRMSRERMARLLHVGWPAGLSWTLDVLSWGIFMNWFVGRLGKLPLAASNMAGQTLHLSFMPTVGLGIATTALVGQNIGRRDFDTARARASTALKLAMGYMFFMGLMFFLFRHRIPHIFLKEATTAAESAVNLRIVELCANVLVLAAIFQAFDAMAIINNSALKGAGDTRFPALAGVLYAWLIFLPLVWLFTDVMDWGVAGAWGGATVYICALGLTLLWRWKRNTWEKIDIFATKPFEPAPYAESPAPHEPGEEVSGG